MCAPLAQLDDSKTRTLAQREELYEAVLACATRVSVIVAPAREVDRSGVHRANLSALARALHGLDAPPARAAPVRRLPRPARREHRAIVGGDGLSAAIAAASIIAKVTRDRSCGALHADYPAYGFDGHVGYSTPEHREALREPRAVPAAPALVRDRADAAALAAHGLMTRAHALGRRGETLATWLVRLRGGRVLARNTRIRGACEVDIVARYGRTLAVVEVKAAARRRCRRGRRRRQRVAGLSRSARVARRQPRLRVGRSASVSISSRSTAIACAISPTRSLCNAYVSQWGISLSSVIATANSQTAIGVDGELVEVEARVQRAGHGGDDHRRACPIARSARRASGCAPASWRASCGGRAAA